MSEEEDGLSFPDDWNPGLGCLVAGVILIFWGIIGVLIVLWLRSTV